MRQFTAAAGASVQDEDSQNSSTDGDGAQSPALLVEILQLV